MKAAKTEQDRKAREAAAAEKLAGERETAEAESRRAATEGARAASAINIAVANAMASQEGLQDAKDAEDLKLQQAQDQLDRDAEALAQSNAEQDIADAMTAFLQQ